MNASVPYSTRLLLYMRIGQTTTRLMTPWIAIAQIAERIGWCGSERNGQPRSGCMARSARLATAGHRAGHASGPRDDRVAVEREQRPRKRCHLRELRVGQLRLPLSVEADRRPARGGPHRVAREYVMVTEFYFRAAQLGLRGNQLLSGEGAELLQCRSRVGDKALVAEFDIGKARGGEHVQARVPCQPLGRRLDRTGLRHEHLAANRTRHPPPAGPRVRDGTAVAYEMNDAHIAVRHPPQQASEGRVLALVDDHLRPGDPRNRGVQLREGRGVVTDRLAHAPSQPRRPVQGQRLRQVRDTVDLAELLGVHLIPATEGLLPHGAPEGTRAKRHAAAAIDVVEQTAAPEIARLPDAHHARRLTQYTAEQGAAAASVPADVQNLHRGPRHP